MIPTINTVLTGARQRLAGTRQSALEAEILLAHSLETSRSFLYANPELVLPHTRVRAFDGLLQSRLSGTPIAYLTGQREFWSLPLEVTPDTLIPRPETELLVETALELIPKNEACRVADLGTGSGAVALAIASERPDAKIIATDISKSALAIARKNAASLEIQNIEFIRSDWFESVNGQFQLVVSNPPYIASGDEHLQKGDVRFEPRLALAAGRDGLDSIRTIISTCLQALCSEGYVLLEHGYNQAAAVRKLLSNAGLGDVKTLKDLELRDRITLAQRTVKSDD